MHPAVTTLILPPQLSMILLNSSHFPSPFVPSITSQSPAYTPLTKQNAFLLLDEIRNLKYKQGPPAKFLTHNSWGVKSRMPLYSVFPAENAAIQDPLKLDWVFSGSKETPEEFSKLVINAFLT